MQKLVINNYIREIKLSEKRREKYFEKGKGKQPTAVKYQDETKYRWSNVYGFSVKRRFLIEIATGKRVIANPKASGTPNVKPINGQSVYNQSIARFERAKLVDQMHEFFEPYVETLNPIVDLPVKMDYVFYDSPTVKGQYFDVDNRAWLYVKAFQDVLAKSNKIKEDDNRFIRGYSIDFIPIEDESKRKLEISIYKV